MSNLLSEDNIVYDTNTDTNTMYNDDPLYFVYETELDVNITKSTSIEHVYKIIDNKIIKII